MKKICIYLMVLVFGSCEQPFIIDEQQVSSSVVIEGLITNESKNNFVKVSRTTGFYDTGNTPRISDAKVRVVDSENNTFEYVGNQDAPGYYYPETPYVGIVGRTYQLIVEVDSEVYQATEELMPVTTIDSLSYFLDEEEQEDQKNNSKDVDFGDEGRYYQVQLYTKEPQETKDYYLFKFYRDGELINYDGEDVYYADDEIVQENIDGIAFNDWYKLGEMAKIEMYSLTREAFLYYSDLDIVLNNDGGLFSPVPTNPRGNFSNGALGLLQVSAMVSDSIRVE